MSWIILKGNTLLMILSPWKVLPILDTLILDRMLLGRAGGGITSRKSIPELFREMITFCAHDVRCASDAMSITPSCGLDFFLKHRTWKIPYFSECNNRKKIHKPLLHRFLPFYSLITTEFTAKMSSLANKWPKLVSIRHAHYREQGCHEN